ncbi:MAG: 2Fe-2S iron-sulfur cluster binding domain-containing protein, partial [Rubrivivax sp.]
MSTDVSTQSIQCEADGFEFEAVPGTTLMQALKSTGFDIEASCEGCLACATCHVMLKPEWYERLGPPAADEQAMLDCLAVTSPTSP